MMCNHCKANVENCLSKIEGVTAVRVELAESVAYIKGHNLDNNAIIAAIREAGYEYVED